MSTTRRRRHNVSRPDIPGTALPSEEEREPTPLPADRPTDSADPGSGEVILDFEDAVTRDADELPMLAKDLPAPLTINRGALNDELDGDRREAPARPKLNREPPAAASAPESSDDDDGDFESLLSRLSGDDKPLESTSASPPETVKAGPSAAQDPARSPAPPDEEDEEELFRLDDETEAADLADDDDFLDMSDTSDSADIEEDEDTAGLGQPPAADNSEGEVALADNEDFWATLEASSEHDAELGAPSLVLSADESDVPEPAPQRSVPRFGRRPEPASIDPEVIAKASQQRKAAPPTAPVVASADEEDNEFGALAVDEQSADPKEWHPPVHLAARVGVFAGPNALSLISPNLREDVDELNHALSAFADLEPGQRGFIRISLRAYPEFKQESRAWLSARKTGQDPDGASKKPHHVIGAWMKYFSSLLWFEANKANPHALGGKVAPMAPGKRGDVKELTASKAGNEEAQAWKDAERKVLATPHYETDLRIGVVGKTDSKEALERIVEEVAAGFDVYSTPHQELVWAPTDAYDAAIGCMGIKRNASVSLALSADEVGELARVPDDLTRPQGVQVKRSYFKELPLSNPLIIEDPYNPPKGLIPLGIMNPRSEDAQVFGMRVAELDKHMYYAGATGSGKSELMKWLVFGVAKADYPLVVIDPHGALSDDVLNALVVNCPERLNDIVLCDLSDSDWPVALNPLDVRNFVEIEPTVHSIMEMLERQMNLGQSAPRAINLAQQAIAALCEANLAIKDPDTKCTLLHVVSFFLDTEFRRLVMEFCSNVSIRETFDPEKGPFEVLSEKQQTEYSMPIIRAFQPLGSSDSFSAVFSSGENRLDFGKLISSKAIVLVKLSRFSHQKKLGEFVGALILPWLLSTMDTWGRKRDDETGEYHGRGCRVFVDEAASLIGPRSSAVELLASSRKWDLGLVTTSQYPSQMDKTVLEALFANTNSKISLKLDPSESGTLAKSIAGVGGKVSGGDIADLPNFHYYANVLLPTGEGASSSGPFSAACLPPINCELTAEHKELRELVRKRSHDLVCNRKDEIADKRQHVLEHIKGALGQMLIERADSEVPAGGDYAIKLDPLDEQRDFGGW